MLQVSRKKEILGNLLADKIHPTTFLFMELLLEKNRENLFPEIIDHFFRLVDESRGIVRGTLYSAHPLTSDQIKAVKKQLDRITGKDVVVAPQQDPSLVAGFIIRLDDWVIDHSLKNQLNKLREKLLINE